MENNLPLDPASAYAAPTALPPINTLPEDPSEAYSGIQSQSFPEPRTVDQQGLQDVSIPDAMTVYGTGQLAKLGVEGGTAAVKGIGSLFETPESLKSAGITASTLEHMAPGGQNPADYVKAVENQLSDKGVLATTAKDTWDKMFPKAQEVGRTIGKTLQQLKAESTNISNKFGEVLDPTVVDAQPVLQPLSEKIAQMATGVYSDTQNAAKPFQQAYNALLNTAQQQGGKLTLEDIEPVLKETGSMMDQGEEARALYGPVYGRLADVRDSMVNTIAQQSKNPELAQTLLKNNADYSTYMRILPSVEKAAYKEAIKEGVSAYQKHIGPLGEKMAILGGTYALARGVVDKILGTGK